MLGKVQLMEVTCLEVWKAPLPTKVDTLAATVWGACLKAVTLGNFGHFAEHWGLIAEVNGGVLAGVSYVAMDFSGSGLSIGAFRNQKDARSAMFVSCPFCSELVKSVKRSQFACDLATKEVLVRDLVVLAQNDTCTEAGYNAAFNNCQHFAKRFFKRVTGTWCY